MRSLNGRLAQIEKQIAQLPDPGERAQAEKFKALEEQLFAMSKEERLIWLDRQIIDMSAWPGWLPFLTDWREFLILEGQNVAPSWDRERRQFVHNENSKRWYDLLGRRPAWGGWTGEGLPPELSPDHPDCIFKQYSN